MTPAGLCSTSYYLDTCQNFLALKFWPNGSFKVYPLQVFVSVWNFRTWIQVLSLLPSSHPLALNFCLSFKYMTYPYTYRNVSY